jgi:uncharacterized protein YbjT (DUF2867 family)
MILVTGATGLNGGELIRKLSARGVPVRGMARDAAKAAALAALPNVEIVEGDMARPESLAAPLRGLDVQSNFIDAAKRAGVTHVVKLSGIMPERDSAFRFARMHGEIEARLEASGIPFTHLRGGEFMPAWFRQAPSIAATGTFMLPMENARIASIDVGDMAEIAALTLTGSGHEWKIYHLTGPEALTMAEVAERLSAATGREVRYINVDPQAHRAANLSRGMPPYLADGLVELFAERRNGKEATVYADAGGLLGRRPVSFSEFAERNAAIFRGDAPAKG